MSTRRVLCYTVRFKDQFKGLSILYNQKNNFSSSIPKFNNNTTLDFNNGLVRVTIPLVTNKQEKCLFTLKPFNDSVGSFIEYIKNEDKNIANANLYTTDDLRISNNTPIGVLIQQPFKLKINELTYTFDPPKNLANTNEQLASQNDIEGIKALVSKLYTNLHIGEQEKLTEQQILQEMQALRTELEPLEQKKEQLAEKAKKHTNRMIWLGLGLMSLQTGILARLTWFEYSWDIVEPISYFVTYVSVIGVYAYFVLTRKEYDYESASDRIFLRHFHKNAVKANLDVQKYNNLKESLYNLEQNLNRLKEKNSIDNLKPKNKNLS